MKDKIQKLCDYIAPSGQERALGEALLASVADVADETLLDALGNAIATKHGSGPHVMLIAHADESGVMVIDIDEQGFLRVIPVGNISAPSLVGRHIRFGNGTTGMVGVESHVKAQDVGFDHLYVDIGEYTATGAEKRVRIGDSGVVLEPVAEIGANKLAGRALDNRVGCVIAMEAFRSLASAGKRVSVVFSSLHQPGARGAKTATFRLTPDLAIVIDAVPAGDMPHADRMAVKLGNGPVIKVMDATAIVSPQVKSHIENAAERLGIAHQYEVSQRGRTDAGAVAQTQGGVRVGGIGYPARYVGGPSTMVDLTDIENTLRLVIATAESYAGA